MHTHFAEGTKENHCKLNNSLTITLLQLQLRVNDEMIRAKHCTDSQIRNVYKQMCLKKQGHMSTG